MAVRSDVVLFADGGDMTVGRRVNTYVYGAFDVQIPEGREQEATDGRLRNAYMARPAGEFARFDFGFSRADVTLNMQAERSNLEETLDNAARRTDGAVFIERDITQAGLGRFVPDLDFDEGDIVTVDIWGRRVPLPVTAIDWVAGGTEGVSGWRVHVGGQLVSDAAGLRQHNDAVLARLEQERRERLKAVGEVSTQASAAQATANTAQSTANTAQSAANAARVKADAAQTELNSLKLDSRSLADSITKRVQDGVEANRKVQDAAAFVAAAPTPEELDAAQSAAIFAQANLLAIHEGNWQAQGALNELNEKFKAAVLAWQQKTEAIDAAQQEQLEALQQEQMRAVEELQAKIAAVSETKTIVFSRFGCSDPSVQFEKITTNLGEVWRVTIDPGLSAVHFTEKWRSSDGHISQLTVSTDNEGNVSNVTADTNEWFYAPGEAPTTYQVHDHRVGFLTLVNTGTIQRKFNTNTSQAFTPARSTWTPVAAVTVPRTGQKRAKELSMFAKVMFSAATFHDTYGIRIKVGTTVVKTYTRSQLGPLTFLESGRRAMSLQVSGLDAPAGQDWSVEVYSTGSADSQRRVESVEFSGSYLEDK